MNGDITSVLQTVPDIYEFVDVPVKKCFCHCKTFQNGRCIEQFTQEEQDNIRCIMLIINETEKDSHL